MVHLLSLIRAGVRVSPPGDRGSGSCLYDAAHSSTLHSTSVLQSPLNSAQLRPRCGPGPFQILPPSGSFVQYAVGLTGEVTYSSNYTVHVEGDWCPTALPYIGIQCSPDMCISGLALLQLMIKVQIQAIMVYGVFIYIFVYLYQARSEAFFPPHTYWHHFCRVPLC